MLERQSRKFGDDHLETHFVRNSLAMAYEANNEPQTALPLCKAVATAFQKQFGNQDPNTIQSQLNLASVLVTAQLPQEAAKVFETALPSARASKDKPDRNLAGALTSYGEALLRLERYQQAEAVLSESLKIHEQFLLESWKTFHTLSLSGEANLRLEKTNIAATQLRSAYDGLLSKSDDIPYGRRRVILSQAIKRLIELASSRNETDQVDEWQSRLDNL
jgi:tetratricopeptide (TPR) repeat protein